MSFKTSTNCNNSVVIGFFGLMDWELLYGTGTLYDQIGPYAEDYSQQGHPKVDFQQ